MLCLFQSTSREEAYNSLNDTQILKFCNAYVMSDLLG